MSKLVLLYKDEDILAFDKPAGVVIAPDAHHHANTFSDAVHAKYPTAQLLHRLDRDTSGVVLFAKNDEAFTYFKKLFHDREIQKEYTALVGGIMSKLEGEINAPIARSSQDPRKRVVGGKKGRAREAVTIWKVKEVYEGPFTLMSVFPKTGRTHQIRSHLSSIARPIVGDDLYGNKKSIVPEGFGRMFLHATSITFVTRKGRGVTITSPLPEDLSGILKALRRRLP